MSVYSIGEDELEVLEEEEEEEELVVSRMSVYSIGEDELEVLEEGDRSCGVERYSFYLTFTSMLI
jgi:hypothetical protein